MKLRTYNIYFRNDNGYQHCERYLAVSFDLVIRAAQNMLSQMSQRITVGNLRISSIIEQPE